MREGRSGIVWNRAAIATFWINDAFRGLRGEQEAHVLAGFINPENTQLLSLVPRAVATNMVQLNDHFSEGEEW